MSDDDQLRLVRDEDGDGKMVHSDVLRHNWISTFSVNEKFYTFGNSMNNGMSTRNQVYGRCCYRRGLFTKFCDNWL